MLGSMLKKNCADHASDILIHQIYLDILVHPSILVYCVSCNLTPHFESGLIRPATPTGLCSVLLLYLACMGLPHCSLLDSQSSQARPSSPKLSQPRVDLIDIAAPPSVCSCCISSCRRKYRLCCTSIAYDILVYNSIAQCVLVYTSIYYDEPVYASSLVLYMIYLYILVYIVYETSKLLCHLI
jgi:hypothetical protein